MSPFFSRKDEGGLSLGSEAPVLVVHNRFGEVEGEYVCGLEMTAGRSRDNDIVLGAENVSRYHAKFYYQDGTLYVEDLKSANGTFVDGERVSGKVPLSDGSVVRMGDYLIRVRLGGGPSLKRQSFARLVGLNLPVANQVFEISKPSVLVGRSEEAGIVLADPSVSRFHARIFKQADGSLVVEDLGSANGTFVNGRPVKVCTLEHGATVRFGNLEFQVETSWEGSIALSGETIRKRLTVGKVLWALVVLLATAFVVLLVLFLVRKGGEEEPPTAKVSEATTEVSDKATLEQERVEALEKARKALNEVNLAEARKFAKWVLDRYPLDPEGTRLLNRITMEEKALEVLQSVNGISDPVVVATRLLEIPEGSLFREKAVARLREVAKEVKRRMDKACRAKKALDCARLKGVMSKLEGAGIRP